MPRPRYGALLSRGLRTMSRLGAPAIPRPVVKAAPPASSISTRSSVESFRRMPVYSVITTRCRLLVVGIEAIGPTIGCAERRMRLKDEICLPGEPVTRVGQTREHRGRVVGGGLTRAGLRRFLGRLLGRLSTNRARTHRNQHECASQADCDVAPHSSCSTLH